MPNKKCLIITAIVVVAVVCVTVFAIKLTQFQSTNNNNEEVDADKPDGFIVTDRHRFVTVDRDGWGAKPPKHVDNMTNPVPFVIIHHSYIPPACNTTDECVTAMQWMQNFHQNDRGWNDIGYSFAVGGDGKAYVGRGWSAVGAHAPGYNFNSIGICVIGDWRHELPPRQQLDTVVELIEHGVAIGAIVDDFTLYGHRQVRDTECPGDRLFAEIGTWPHFKPVADDKTRNIVPTR